MRVLIISQPKDKLKVWLVNTKNSEIEAKIGCENTTSIDAVLNLKYKNKNIEYKVENQDLFKSLKAVVALLKENNIIKSINDFDRVVFSHEEIKFNGKKSEIEALEEEIKPNKIEFDELIKN